MLFRSEHFRCRVLECIPNTHLDDVWHIDFLRLWCFLHQDFCEGTNITDKQKKTIEDFGLNPDTIEDAGKASLLIDRLHKRKAEGLSTPKQIRFLENKGFKNVGTWTNMQASKMISRISASGWRIPKGISPATYQPS